MTTKGSLTRRTDLLEKIIERMLGVFRFIPPFIKALLFRFWSMLVDKYLDSAVLFNYDKSSDAYSFIAVAILTSYILLKKNIGSESRSQSTRGSTVTPVPFRTHPHNHEW